MGREEQEKLKEKKERFRKQLLNDYRDTFGTKHGKRVLNHILQQCHFYSTTFTGNSATFAKEGKRQVALNIISAIMQTEPGIVAEVLHANEELKKLFKQQD